MSSTLIGILLDEALRFALSNAPKSLEIGSPKNGLPPELEGKRIDPRSVARALLANHLRNALAGFATNQELPLSDDGNPCPTYSEIVAYCRKPRLRNILANDENGYSPDVIYSDLGSGNLKAIEVGYGFEPDVALAAIDRLLGFWYSGESPIYNRHRVDFVSYIFVHEIKSGDIDYKIEREFSDWVLEHYGPFNGLSRMHMPMMPRLTRSTYSSRNSGVTISATDLSSQINGFISFCISYG